MTALRSKALRTEIFLDLDMPNQFTEPILLKAICNEYQPSRNREALQYINREISEAGIINLKSRFLTWFLSLIQSAFEAYFSRIFSAPSDLSYLRHSNPQVRHWMLDQRVNFLYWLRIRCYNRNNWPVVFATENLGVVSRKNPPNFFRVLNATNFQTICLDRPKSSSTFFLISWIKNNFKNVVPFPTAKLRLY